MPDARSPVSTRANSGLLPGVSLLALVLTLGATTAGCAAVGSIFKAGIWVGVIVAAVVVVVVLFLFRSFSR